MTTSIFREIKSAEAEAERMLQQAEEKRQALLAEARQKAARLQGNAAADIEKEKQKKIDALTVALEEERKSILESGRKKTDALKKRAAKNQNAAIDFILDAFEKAM